VPIESDRFELAGGPAEAAVGLSPHEALPGLAAAFDEGTMKGHLQAALFGSGRPAYTVVRCTPTRPLYIPGECCVLRYQVQARNDVTGAVVEPIVMGRVFPSRSACTEYMSRKLAPVAARMRGRPEVAELAAPAAVIEPLDMVVHVWPIDGELPTLVEATDPRRMLEVFRETLPETMGQPFAVEDCEVELVSYRRRQRCVLRYTVAGRAAGSDDVRSIVVYGKVTGVGNETLASPLVETLRDRVRRHGAAHGPTLPRLLAWRPDLQLALLEAVPGEAQIRPALRARLRARPSPAALPLEEMIATCAYAAAVLHTSGLEIGPVRTLDGELVALEREVASAQQFVPSFGERAHGWLERIAASAGRSEPLELRLGHGDFNHGQLLFDAAGSALLDLDTLCRAEPALDLGKFLAHLRAETEKLRRRASVSSRLGEELAEHFLRAYVGATGAEREDEEALRARTAIYEATALVRLAVRSQHDFEQTRLEIATGLLEERLSAMAADSSVKRRQT
jgi:hypothetical protein